MIACVPLFGLYKSTFFKIYEWRIKLCNPSSTFKSTTKHLC